MRFRNIIVIVFWFLFCVLLVVQITAEAQAATTRDEIIDQTLKYFELNSQKTEAPVAFDRAYEHSSSRDLKIRAALERFEDEQLSSEQENPEPPVEAQYLREEILSKPTINIQGNVRTEVAHHLFNTAEFTKIKNQLSLTARGEFFPALRYRISGQTYYDAAYDIGNYYSDSATSDQRTEMELRDTYVDYSSGPWDLRIGKQQVVWGEAVGVFVADVVNARDLREFILPDFESMRIPEWGTDLEYTHDNFHSEFVFLPGIEFNKLGVTGSEFVFPLPVPENTPFTYRDAKPPKGSFENSKVGTRFNYLSDGYDMGVFYLHSWTQSPVLYRTIGGGSYDFDSRYKRLDTFGATVSKEIKEVVFKGDLVYTKDDFFSVIDPLNTDGIVRSSRLEYLLGFDYIFFDKWDFNLQFIQNIIFDHTDNMTALDKYNNSFSLRISRAFLNRKLQTEFLVIYGVNAPDFLYQSKVKYNLTDSWQAAVGVDVFAGNSSGVFGYFRNQSRYYSELIYKF